MYFAIDEKKRLIVNDDGEEFSVEQFKIILTKAQQDGRIFDMTQRTQRFINLDFSFEALAQFYSN